MLPAASYGRQAATDREAPVAEINMKLLYNQQRSCSWIPPRSPKGVIPWNKGKLLGQKRPLKLKEIWG
jgi:hypothetical protein